MLNKQEFGQNKTSPLENAGGFNSKPSVIFDANEKIKAKDDSKKKTIQVHPMPAKFVKATQHAGRLTPNQGKNTKKIALIAIALALGIVVVIAGIIYFSNRQSQVSDANKAVVQNQNTEQAKEINTNEKIDQNTEQAKEINTNEKIDQNTEQAKEINTNENINNNLNEQQSLDKDNDGLSYEEELVFNTNPNLEDTDKDGYKDGQEITSLYNPLLPNQGLAQSGLVTKFSNGAYSYSLLRPSAWLINSVERGTSKIVILPNSETGESFSVEISSNTDDKSLVDILNDMSNTLGAATNYQNYSLDGQTAYRSLDGQKVLTLKNNFIFIIVHEVSPFGAVNFTNTFEMMLNSFKWTTTEIPEVNV